MRVLYLYLVLSLLSTSVYADQDSIIIHKIQLKLGMPEKTTMKVLSQIYDLKIVKGLADYWVIFEKGSKFKYVGSISFKEGNVSSVSRNIGTYEGKNSFEFAEALHQALSNLQKSGEVVSEANSYAKSNLRDDSIIFKCKNKAIIITIGSGQNVQKTVYIEESLDSNKHEK